MKNGYLPVSIKVEDRLEYYNVLDLYATTGNIERFIKLIGELENKRLDETNNIIKQQMEAN